MAYNIGSLWDVVSTPAGYSFVIDPESSRHADQIADLDRMTAEERAPHIKKTFGLDEGLFSVGRFASQARVKVLVRRHFRPGSEVRARAAMQSPFELRTREPEQKGPASSRLEFVSLGTSRDFETLYSQRRESFKNFILTYLTDLAQDIRMEIESLPREDQNRSFLGFVKMLGNRPAEAMVFLRQNRALSKTIGDYILREEMAHREEIQNFIRLQYFVKAQHGFFVLPPLYFDPHNSLDDNIARRYSDLDDIDLAWEFLRVQSHSASSDSEEEQAIRESFSSGGFLFDRLLDATRREIINCPRIFGCPKIAQGLESYFSEEVPEPMQIFRLSNSQETRKIMEEGYDPLQKEGYTFFPLSGFSLAHFLDEGVSHAEEDTMVGIAHTFSWLTFASYLIASEGEACSSETEINTLANATLLLRALVDNAQAVKTRVVFYSLGINQHGMTLMTDTLLRGFHHEMDLGQTLARVVGIPAPEDLPPNVVNSDDNDARLFFNLLFHSVGELQDFFEMMLKEYPEMARRAKSFYAAMPYFTIPILKRWEQEWVAPSLSLKRFLFRTLRHAEAIAKKFTPSP